MFVRTSTGRTPATSATRRNDSRRQHSTASGEHAMPAVLRGWASISANSPTKLPGPRRSSSTPPLVSASSPCTTK